MVAEDPEILQGSMNLILRKILYLVCNINLPYGGNTRLFCILYFSISVQWPLTCLLTHKKSFPVALYASVTSQAMILHLCWDSLFVFISSSVVTVHDVSLWLMRTMWWYLQVPKPWRLLHRIVLNCSGMSSSLLNTVLFPPHQQSWSVMQSIRCFFYFLCNVHLLQKKQTYLAIVRVGKQQQNAGIWTEMLFPMSNLCPSLCLFLAKQSNMWL